MKSNYFLSIAFCFLASCHSAIKNEDNDEKNVDSMKISVNSETPIPKANNNLVVNAPEDLIGYWVGMFVPNGDSDITGYYGESLYWDRSNKINVSIDSINGNIVVGHSVDAGTKQSFKGNWELENGGYKLDLKEPGTNKYDGTFAMSIPKNDSLLIGNWSSFGKIDIPKRRFRLQKKTFRYNPSQELESVRFGDWEKYKTKHFTEGEDGQPEDYYGKTYFATTDDVLKYNASEKLLSEKEVANLKKGDLFIIRNSIYARHGFSFKNRPLRVFFDHQDWYIPIYSDIKKDFTNIEKQNIELLLRYEKNAKAYYDKFGRG